MDTILTAENLVELLNDKKFNDIRFILNESLIADTANILEKVENKENLLVLFRLLKKDVAAEVFSYLSSQKQQLLVESLTDKELSNIIQELYIDDTVDFIEEMPANVVERVLKNTSAETRSIINQILNYPENSAGSIMTTEFLDLKSNMTVEKAFERIRKIAVDKETISICYVTSHDKILEGVVSIRELILAEPKQIIGDIMTTQVVSVNTNDDQEKMALLFSKYDFNTLPVVDNENRLVGIVTVDDIIDIIHEETTEDFQKMAAIVPTEDSYLDTTIFTHAKKRLGWLIFLMLSTVIVGSIISAYEEAFVVMPSLVAFIPMIMGTGGNSGAQTATLMIRGLAINEITFKDFFKIFFKEFNISIIVGSVLAVINFLRIWIFNGDVLLGVTVSATLFITVILAKLIGFSLPFLAKAVKLDPALMASPIITTLVDTLSMVSYFVMATLILGL